MKSIKDIDPAILDVMYKASVVPIAVLADNVILWRRVPVGQGDEGSFEFSTRALMPGDMLWAQLIVEVYDSARENARRELQAEARELLGLESPSAAHRRRATEPVAAGDLNNDLSVSLAAWRQTFESDAAFRAWLTTPLRLLQGLSPVDLLASGRGRELHEWLLDALSGQAT